MEERTLKIRKEFIKGMNNFEFKDFSLKTQLLLKEHNITTLKQVMDLTLVDLLNISNTNKGFITEIYVFLDNKVLARKYQKEMEEKK